MLSLSPQVVDAFLMAKQESDSRKEVGLTASEKELTKQKEDSKDSIGDLPGDGDGDGAVRESAEEARLREEVEAMAGIEAAVCDNNDGTYTVSYVPAVAGQYRVRVEVSGVGGG